MHDRARRLPMRLHLLRHVPPPLRMLAVFLGTPKVSLGVSAIIWDGEGRVLLAHHTYRHPGWGFPSGLVGSHEQPEAALIRELGEELAASATVICLLHAEIDALVRHLTLYYAVRLHGVPRHDGIEIDELRFVPLEEIEALIRTKVPSWLAAAEKRGT